MTTCQVVASNRVLEVATQRAAVLVETKPPAMATCVAGVGQLAVAVVVPPEDVDAIVRGVPVARTIALNVPVALLDGRPATPAAWAALLAERLHTLPTPAA